MRVAFSSAYIKLFAKRSSSVFLTGDVGYQALEPIRSHLKQRFINAGVAEQNMVCVAAGMASEGYFPFVYSITPFITLKIVEQVRNNIHLPGLPVTLVGNGGGYGYGIMGPTHHALEDLSIFSSLPQFTSYIPSFDEDLLPQLTKIRQEKKPSYVRLGLAKKHTLELPPYAPVRHLHKGSGATIFVLGPLTHEVLGIQKLNPEVYDLLDIWSVSELPLRLPKQAVLSAQSTQHIFVIEEHREIGGLGSHLLKQLPIFTHLFAKGYQSGTYGNQQFHLNENGLDTDGILKTLLHHLK